MSIHSLVLAIKKRQELLTNNLDVTLFETDLNLLINGT